MNTEFTDQLRAAMAQLPAQVPADLVENVSRRYHRRRVTVAALAAAGTAAVTGLAVIVVTATVPGSGTTPPGDRTTAYVVDHVTNALESLAPSTILFEKTTYLKPDSSEGSEQSWSTLSTTRDQTFTTAGQLRGDESLTETATTTTHLIVDYQTKTWSRITAVLPPESASPSQSPPSCASGAPNGWDPDPHGEAAELRTGVSCGFLTATGGGMVDGVNTIKLSERTGAADQPPANSTMTFWVNATTYLPVRIDQIWVNADYAGGNLQMDLQWLPATPANKAKLTVHIPPDFTHTPWGK
jgi:hypothetical protein